MKKTLLASLAVLAMGFSTSFAATTVAKTGTGTVTYTVVDAFSVGNGGTVAFGNVLAGSTGNVPVGNKVLSFAVKGPSFTGVAVALTNTTIPVGITIAAPVSSHAAGTIVPADVVAGINVTYTFSTLDVDAAYTGRAAESITYTCTVTGTY